jgi:hypothetical protein
MLDVTVGLGEAVRSASDRLVVSGWELDSLVLSETEPVSVVERDRCGKRYEAVVLVLRELILVRLDVTVGLGDAVRSASDRLVVSGWELDSLVLSETEPVSVVERDRCGAENEAEGLVLTELVQADTLSSSLTDHREYDCRLESKGPVAEKTVALTVGDMPLILDPVADSDVRSDSLVTVVEYE